MSKSRHRSLSWPMLVAALTLLVGLASPPAPAYAAPLKDFPSVPLEVLFARCLHSAHRAESSLLDSSRQTCELAQSERRSRASRCTA